MSEPTTDLPIENQIPEPEIQTGKRFSIVWLIPLLALVIGLGLGIRAIQETGPTIKITFESAEGLMPGKTEIKYKDVTVGKVETIALSENLSQVIVTATMTREVTDYLTKDAQFWVVRARVAGGEVSGISTLFSGAYIGMVPGIQGGKATYKFNGLDRPPAIMKNTPGRQFKLQSEQLGSLDIGSSVYYRQVKVGRVTNVGMVEDGTGVFLEIFIEAPYHHQVKRTTRFFNASGLDVAIGADGIRVDTPSLASFLVGGIVFFTPEDKKDAPPAVDRHAFTLYKNRDDANAAAYSYREYYLLYVEETVRGLSAGAPVEFYGIKIGEVISVRLLLDQDKLTFRIPVLIAIEPDRIELAGESVLSEFKLVEKLVEKGLRAQLRMGNLLTGQAYVSMRMHPDSEFQAVRTDDIYPVLPTIPNTLEELTATAKRMLDRFNHLEFEETLADIRIAMKEFGDMSGSKTLESAIDNIDQSFAEFKKVASDLNDGTLPKINAMVEQARESLAQGEEAMESAATVIGESAPMLDNLNRLILDLQNASRAVQGLADYLERHPDAIVFGKGEEK
jgi:paraquat-inducible protein B